MIIDIHAYIGSWPYWPIPQSSAADVVQVMDETSIERAVITSTRSLFVNWSDGNDETLLASANYPERLVAFVSIGPPEPDHTPAARDLDLDKLPMGSGVRLFPQYHTYHPLYEPFVDDVCEWATAKEVPVQLSLRILMNWGMPALDLACMVALVERHPRVHWILAGLNYFQELRAGISLMRRFEAVHLETSCIQGFDAIAKVIAECGSSRLLFGTGMPLQNAAVGVRKIEHARISDTDRDAIFGLNAQRLLKIAG